MRASTTDPEFGRAIVGERLFLLKLARRKFGLAATDAEDVVQQTLLQAWMHRSSYVRHPSGIRCWLVTIMHNVGRTRFRKARSYGRCVEHLDHHSALSYEQQDAAVELGQAIRIMSTMSREHQDALVHAAVGLTHLERIALEDVAMGTIKSRTKRARQTLMNRLDPDAASPVL